jgi:hypothetical protein
MNDSKITRPGSMWKDGKGKLLLAVTAAGFVFFVRFWFLFLPVNILYRLFPVLQWIIGLLPRGGSSSAKIILVLALSIIIVLTLTAGVSTYLFYRLARVFWRRSWPLVTVFAILCLALGWMLWPTACDWHESFRDIPNRTCECTGFSFSFYPPWVLADGATTDYCVGLERPIQP